MTVTTHRPAKDAATRDPDLFDVIDDLKLATPDLLPPYTRTQGLDPRRLALARFLPTIADDDPRTTEAREAFDKLLSRATQRIDPGHSYDGSFAEAVNAYVDMRIRAVAPLAAALDQWVTGILAVPGGAALLDGLWATDVPESVTTQIVAMSGVVEDAALTAKLNTEDEAAEELTAK